MKISKYTYMVDSEKNEVIFYNARIDIIVFANLIKVSLAKFLTMGNLQKLIQK